MSKFREEWKGVPTFNKIVMFAGLLYTLVLVSEAIRQGDAAAKSRYQRAEKVLRDGSVRTHSYHDYTFKTKTNKGTLHGWRYQCINNSVMDNHSRVVLDTDGVALECTETEVTKK